MDRITRRKIVGGGAAAAATITLGAQAVRAQSGRQTLRFVAQADLKILDPIWTTAYITRKRLTIRSGTVPVARLHFGRCFWWRASSPLSSRCRTPHCRRTSTCCRRTCKWEWPREPIHVWITSENYCDAREIAMLAKSTERYHERA